MNQKNIALLVILSSAVCVIAVAQQPTGLTAWPKSHTMTFWTQGGVYKGPVQDVFIGDTRTGAPRGYPRAGAYTNLWTLRAEWEHDPGVLRRKTFFDLEKERYDQIASAIIGTGTGGVADGYDARRKLIDCRKPEVERWIHSEAKRIIKGGFTRAFFDNTMMKVTGFFKPVDPAKPLSDAENVASMAAGTKAFGDECKHLGKPIEMVINLAVPWHWDGAPRWQDASEKCVEFWWNLGVRGVLLEKPEARPADSAAYQSIVATGKAWLARGGNLYVILEDEAKGVALAREWDSERTWVYVR
ncbi:hypothetical protein [Prosthecobacter sp.]|uniref:hypothetical protein n=1 Tax=Prosthecobacter sp. TaxID=1965333 RepID=UPI002ABB9060|nr:hypothetical protein [Prosthecobacter sp.]MDZ4401890.1 hypothetical protein [Prosthecobacter sp.]